MLDFVSYFPCKDIISSTKYSFHLEWKYVISKQLNENTKYPLSPCVYDLLVFSGIYRLFRFPGQKDGFYTLTLSLSTCKDMYQIIQNIRIFWSLYNSCFIFVVSFLWIFSEFYRIKSNIRSVWDKILQIMIWSIT